MFFSSATWAEEEQSPAAFSPGEQTTYEVSYLGLTAGRAQVTVGWATQQFGHEVWPLVCTGQTTDIGRLWPVNDRFVSYWDPARRHPVGADFFVHESKHRRRERYQYDYAQGQALITRQIEGKPRSEFSYPIEEGTVDLAAAGFGLRNRRLAPGEVYDFPVFTGSKLYQMKATVENRESLTTALGPLDVFRVTVNGDFQGKMATQGLITLFYTADDKQLPVRAEAEFLLGKIRIEAVKYEPGSHASTTFGAQ